MVSVTWLTEVRVVSATGGHTAPPPWALLFHVRLTSCCTKSHLRKKLSPPQCPFHIPGPHTHRSAEVSQHLREGVVCLFRREGTGVQEEVTSPRSPELHSPCVSRGRAHSIMHPNCQATPALKGESPQRRSCVTGTLRHTLGSMGAFSPSEFPSQN